MLSLLSDTAGNESGLRAFALREYKLVFFFVQVGIFGFMDGKVPKRIVDAVVASLAKVRKQRGLSHDAISEATGVHRTTVGKVESRKTEPTLLTLVRISRALDCDLGAII